MSEGIRNITNELNENFIIVEQLAKYEKSIINYGNLLMINEQSYSIQEIKNFYPLLDQAYVQSCKIESLALFFFDLIEAGSQNIEIVFNVFVFKLFFEVFTSLTLFFTYERACWNFWKLKAKSIIFRSFLCSIIWLSVFKVIDVVDKDF